MKTIGLGGATGTGKSAIARVIAERDGIAWIDLDRIAWSCYAPGSIAFEKLVARFGRGITGSSGEIERRELAVAAFASDEARADLDAIVHPEVERALRSELAEQQRCGTRALLVEGALLGISPHIDYRLFDRVLWLTAPRSTRIRRLERSGRGGHADRVPGEAEFAAPVTRIDASGTVGDVARRVLDAVGDLLSGD